MTRRRIVPNRSQLKRLGRFSAWAVVVSLSILAAAVGGKIGTAGAQSEGAQPPSFAPEVKIQSEDYVLARSRFRTKLIKTGPAPQQYDPLQVPSGVSEITYESGSLRLKAWINRPVDHSKGKYPAVLFLHGGYAFDQGDWEMSRPYRDAGFVVMTPILRGENGQPGAYSLFYDELDDVVAAAEYLRKQSYVDAKHFYVAGPSVGGTMTMLAAMAYRHFTAGASISGSPDQILLLRYAFANRKGDIPFDQSNPKEIELRSPLAYAASLKCPIRIYYGSEEPHFNVTSHRLAEIAREHGVDAQAQQVKGDHDTVDLPAIKLSIEFFRQLDRR
jgi:dienelactone hydrolase